MNDVKESKKHSLTIEGRDKTTVCGVEEVISCTETAISLVTSAGGIIFSGQNLKIAKLNLDEGLIIFCGTVDMIKYMQKKSPLIKRIFK